MRAEIVEVREVRELTVLCYEMVMKSRVRDVLFTGDNGPLWRLRPWEIRRLGHVMFSSHPQQQHAFLKPWSDNHLPAQ